MAGNLALDFVATVASRETIAHEWLPTPGSLAEWLVLSGAVDTPPKVSAVEFARAIELREALYIALRKAAAGSAPDDRTIALVNAAAAHATPVPVLTSGGVSSSGSTPAALALVARAAQVALTDPRLRFCDGTDCTRPFLDASRGRTRRWCGMAGCGDRAKAAAYRRRLAIRRA
ncbi:CGNR zinc finger domain-containing protein [Microbacterium sp. PF5]|uniref:CGNR zinc finger domain-containing protein n=1 Tax=Microbacterium sp. PF5 TaxID=2305435 RepID=UPI001F0ED67C|nr:CGNR zinc finger domain-containing protein [Microbacterium sp. PF5]